MTIEIFREVCKSKIRSSTQWLESFAGKLAKDPALFLLKNTLLREEYYAALSKKTYETCLGYIDEGNSLDEVYSLLNERLIFLVRLEAYDNEYERQELKTVVEAIDEIARITLSLEEPEE